MDRKWSRCIFCKSPSGESVSCEHIVPESLGNKSHVLPPGIVCDKCNNHFATKVEQPVLESGRFSVRRGMQAIPNKRGHFPAVSGIALPDIPIQWCRYKDGVPFICIDIERDSTAVDRFFKDSERRKGGTLILPSDGQPPANDVFSRFLAKMAVEAMAQRLCEVDDGVEYLVREAQLDAIRDHARYGRPRNWKFHERPIYDANSSDEYDMQTLHEYDFLVTKVNEWYFVIAIFGTEYAINLGCPEVDGYTEWLLEHRQVSPLYYGKNANI